jgi:RNA polymerase sigma factor (sigma-70 family)
MSASCVMGGDDFGRILASARNGNGQAFAQLYESINRRVFGFVSYRGAIDPEGMVNDVFLKVFTKIDTFDGNEIQFAAWVFKIARNTLIDESRSRSRRPDETSLTDAHGVSDAHGDVEVDAFEHMSTVEVLRYLDVLTPEQRDVVVMRVVSDLTIETIAEILDKRVGAVKAMQRRAFRTLAKKFDSEGVPQ